MGFYVLDTIYRPQPISNVYVKLDSIYTIKKKKNKNTITFDVTTHYLCFENKKESPFHKVEITLQDVKKLEDLDKQLYDLAKKDFLKISDES